MALADLLLTPRERVRLRNGRAVLQQLTRIADALERLSPPTQAPLPDSVDVASVSAKFQAEVEELNDSLYRTLGREPTDEELLTEHESRYGK